MNTNRPCGCKSHRSCTVCEAEFGIVPTAAPIYQYIQDCTAQYEYSIGGDNTELEKLGLTGIKILPDFITQEEEDRLISDLDNLSWDVSQSGRRKQNYGPRANFKKRKAKKGQFCGFPACTKFIQDRFRTEPLLEGYRTVEQCSIEYAPEKGSSIEPHIDDAWIWGERIVQLNLMSSTYLTLIPFKGGDSKYNLQDVSVYPRIVEGEQVVYNPFNQKLSNNSYELKDMSDTENVVVKIPLPPRSLLIMFGASRYEWEHCVLREDINSRRAIIAYREFTPPYLPNGELQDVGGEILAAAENFWDEDPSNHNGK